MRVVVCLAVLLTVSLAQGCMKTDGSPGGSPVVGGVGTGGLMDAEIRVVSQPQGGNRVSELSCTFEATEIPGSGAAPLAILVSWTAPCGTHKTETFLFEGGTEAYESIYSEGGYPIGMTFWATISWKDARGQHQVVTSIAACTL